MEKIVPDMEALGGLPVCWRVRQQGNPSLNEKYLPGLSQSREGGEYHIIIVDNGSKCLVAHPGIIYQDFLELCIRCGASGEYFCPVYRRSGGYSYTYFIPGPIGNNWVIWQGYDPEKYYDNRQPVRCVGVLFGCFVRKR